MLYVTAVTFSGKSYLWKTLKQNLVQIYVIHSENSDFKKKLHV